MNAGSLSRTSRGALAGAFAAGIWAASEPLARRISGTGYSDTRLLGRLVVPKGRWLAVGTGLHILNGAAFGALFARMGGHGWKQGLIAAQLENLALWPGMAVIDRIHPDRKDGSWPPLLRNPRVFFQEVAVHAVFGVCLALLLNHRGQRELDANVLSSEWWGNDVTPADKTVLSGDQNFSIELEVPPTVGLVLAHPQRDNRLRIEVIAVDPDRQTFDFQQLHDQPGS